MSNDTEHEEGLAEEREGSRLRAMMHCSCCGTKMVLQCPDCGFVDAEFTVPLVIVDEVVEDEDRTPLPYGLRQPVWDFVDDMAVRASDRIGRCLAMLMDVFRAEISDHVVIRAALKSFNLPAVRLGHVLARAQGGEREQLETAFVKLARAGMEPWAAWYRHHFHGNRRE